ncbi:hypothetical protein [Paenibacillus amylolyticus]|uniref:hypothetical protein n=1 Tax=Paenibacillus TaxID=44249 RepID=UPI003EBF7BC4
MKWIYFSKLYSTKFQAGCLAKRLEQDGWIYGHNEPEEVEVYRSRKGRYGVRFIP